MSENASNEALFVVKWFELRNDISSDNSKVDEALHAIADLAKSSSLLFFSADRVASGGEAHGVQLVLGFAQRADFKQFDAKLAASTNFKDFLAFTVESSTSESIFSTTSSAKQEFIGGFILHEQCAAMQTDEAFGFIIRNTVKDNNVEEVMNENNE